MSLTRIRWMAMVLGVLGVAGVLVLHWLVFFWVGTERTMGIVQRIFYVHVPSAWVTFLAFGVTALCGAAYLWLRDERLDWAAQSAAEGGLVFGAIMLTSGPLWAAYAWGTPWTWEPRLTLTLLMWFVFLGYFLVRASAEDRQAGKRMAAVIGVLGALLIPLVHVSVLWFPSLPSPAGGAQCRGRAHAGFGHADHADGRAAGLHPHLLLHLHLQIRPRAPALPARAGNARTASGSLRSRPCIFFVPDRESPFWPLWRRCWHSSAPVERPGGHRGTRPAVAAGRTGTSSSPIRWRGCCSWAGCSRSVGGCGGWKRREPKIAVREPRRARWPSEPAEATFQYFDSYAPHAIGWILHGSGTHGQTQGVTG